MKQLQKAILFSLALSLSLGVFWACKRTVKNDEILGDSNLKSAPADFTGISGASGIVAFMGSNRALLTGYPKLLTSPVGFGPNKLEYIYFDNTLSHEVSWFVSFKGYTSGAVKNFSGTGDKIAMMDMSFNGSAEGYRFFIAGEKIDYTLSFLGSSISYSGSFEIGTAAYNAISYGGTGTYKILENGDTLFYTKLVDDFDASGQITTSYSDAGDGSGAAVFYQTNSQKVNGNLMFYMKATDNNGNGYCGGSSGESINISQGIREEDPSKVFINAYIYGYGRPNTSLFFQLFENDFSDPTAMPAYFPTRDLDKNDMWFTIVEVNWVGWKLVSIPYSSFKTASNPLSGGGGNRIREPRKLSGFGIELESYPTPGLTVELGLDMVTITTNAPFQP